MYRQYLELLIRHICASPQPPPPTMYMIKAGLHTWQGWHWSHSISWDVVSFQVVLSDGGQAWHSGMPRLTECICGVYWIRRSVHTEHVRPRLLLLQLRSPKLCQTVVGRRAWEYVCVCVWRRKRKREREEGGGEQDSGLSCSALQSLISPMTDLEHVLS